MKHGCTFYLDKEKNGFCPINVAVTYAGTRIRYYTGYRIKKECFPVKDKDGNIVSYEAKKNSVGLEGRSSVKYNSINRRINEITNELSNLFEPLRIAPDKNVVIERLNFLCKKVETDNSVSEDELWNMADRFLKTVDVTPQSRKQLKSAIKHFKLFENSLSYKLEFNNITGDTIEQFENFLKDGTRGRNSVSSILKRVQRFFSWALKDQKLRKVEVTIVNPFQDYSIPPELYGTPIILSKSERDFLFNLKIENERIRKVRDIFIFQCYCGARISDLMKLTVNNLNGDILKYIPQKTIKDSIKEVEIPLNENAVKIIKQYNDSEGYLLPRMSYTEINRTLKSLFKIPGKGKPNGLDRLVSKINPKTGLTEFVPLHDVASTHLARRTFSGLMYAAGHKDDVIASMTGHSENSKAFKRYRAVDMALKRKATKNQ